jgi:hypothetical protein
MMILGICKLNGSHNYAPAYHYLLVQKYLTDSGISVLPQPPYTSDLAHTNLYASPDVIREIKSRRMRWVGHIAFMGKMRNHRKFWLENLNRKDHLEDTGLNKILQ